MTYNSSFTGAQVDESVTKTQAAGTTVLGTGNTPIQPNATDLEITDKIVHSGDLNTAIRFPAPDTVTVETAGGERLRIDSSGNVGIGTTSPDSPIDVRGDAVPLHIHGDADLPGAAFYNTAGQLKWAIASRGVDSDALYFSASPSALTGTNIANSAQMSLLQNGDVKINNLGTGTVYSNAGILTNTNPSDERLKDHVEVTGYGLSTVESLRPVEFNWRDTETHGDARQLGFIAQEVQSVLPEIVRGNDEDGFGLETMQIIPVLVKAIQELTVRVAELEDKQ